MRQIDGAASRRIRRRTRVELRPRWHTHGKRGLTRKRLEMGKLRRLLLGYRRRPKTWRRRLGIARGDRTDRSFLPVNSPLPSVLAIWCRRTGGDSCCAIVPADTFVWFFIGNPMVNFGERWSIGFGSLVRLVRRSRWTLLSWWGLLHLRDLLGLRSLLNLLWLLWLLWLID